MSESTPDGPPPPVYAQPWAVRLGFALVAIFTLLLGLAFMDKGKRQELETVTETTAVGDTQYFKFPSGAALPLIAAALAGKPLAVAQVEPIDIRDTHTVRVGQDSDRGLTIYELSTAATEPERKKVGDGRLFLLKTGPNEYLPARAAQ